MTESKVYLKMNTTYKNVTNGGYQRVELGSAGFLNEWRFKGGQSHIVNGIDWELVGTHVDIFGTPTSLEQSWLMFDAESDVTHGAADKHIIYVVILPEVEVHADVKSGVVRRAYPKIKVSASGGKPPYTFKKYGDVPPGLDVDPESGIFTGVPEKKGHYKFFLGATDSVGHGGLDSGMNGWTECTVSISPEMQFSPSDGYLPTAIVNKQYPETKISVTGGTPPYTFKMLSTCGLRIDPNSGVLSGSPSQIGQGVCVVMAKDSEGYGGEIETGHIYSVSVENEIEIFPTLLPSQTSGKSYPKIEVVPVGGIKPYTFKSFGLPSTLSLDEKTGVLSGFAPTAVKDYTFYLGATDHNGSGGHERGMNGWRSYTIKITRPDVEPPVITTHPVTGDLAIGKLKGVFLSGASGAIDVSGTISGAGLGKDRRPSGVTFLVASAGRQPTEAHHVLWADEWASDGWGFTIKEIAAQSHDTVAMLEIHATLDGITSKVSKVLFSLEKFLSTPEFRDEDNLPCDLLKVRGNSVLKFHFVVRHAIDRLSISIKLPDGISIRGNVSVPGEFQPHEVRDGGGEKLIATIKNESKLTVPAGKDYVSLDFSVPISVSAEFRGGTASLIMRSDSAMISTESSSMAASIVLDKSN